LESVKIKEENEEKKKKENSTLIPEGIILRYCKKKRIVWKKRKENYGSTLKFKRKSIWVGLESVKIKEENED